MESIEDMTTPTVQTSPKSVEDILQSIGVTTDPVLLPCYPEDPEIKAVRNAREAVRTYFHGLPEGTIDDAVLCVSEIASNAEVHAGGITHIKAFRALGGIALVIGNRESDDTVPTAREASSDEGESGRGLRIVKALSDQWGYVKMDPSTSEDHTATDVWFYMKTAA